jgi:hypothetical protein
MGAGPEDAIKEVADVALTVAEGVAVVAITSKAIESIVGTDEESGEGEE